MQFYHIPQFITNLLFDNCANLKYHLYLDLLHSFLIVKWWCRDYLHGYTSTTCPNTANSTSVDICCIIVAGIEFAVPSFVENKSCIKAYRKPSCHCNISIIHRCCFDSFSLLLLLHLTITPDGKLSIFTLVKTSFYHH